MIDSKAGNTSRPVRRGRHSRTSRVARVLLPALAVLTTLVGCGDTTSERTTFEDANLIIISLDTLRADGLSGAGGPAGISPVLDAFAREAVVFEHARAPAPHTAPSHMSLFTSLYPSVHGVQNVAHVLDPDTGKRQAIIYPLPERFPTLAELLQDRGFTTIGLTDGGNVNPAHGFPRGFDAYTKGLSGVADQLADAEQWLGNRVRPLGANGETAQLAEDVSGIAFDGTPAGRFFLFWHTYEIHAPYVPPQEYVDEWAPADYTGPMRDVVDELAGLTFREKWGRMKLQFWKERDSFGDEEAEYLRGLYHGGIEYTDTVIERLFDKLRDEGLLDNSIIVLLSDHGEEFNEHGRWQHEQLYEECLRVPLMIRLPGGLNGGTRIRTAVSLMDVMPTVLDLLGIDERGVDGLAMQGRSLARSVLEGAEPEPLPVVSELRSDRPGNPQHDWMVAHYHEGMKFLYDQYRGRRVDGEVVYDRYLYDLGADPGERTNLADADGASRVDSFLELHQLWHYEVQIATEGVEAVIGEVDRDMWEQLRRLGYVEGEWPGGPEGPALPTSLGDR